MLGFLIGAVMGCAALYCLNLFSQAVTNGEAQKAVLPMLGNVTAVAVGLIIPAFLLRDQLMWAGIGLAGALIAGALILFTLRVYKKKG